MFERNEKTDVLKDLYEGKINFAEKPIPQKKENSFEKDPRIKTEDKIRRFLESEEKLSSKEAIKLIDELTLPYSDDNAAERYESFRNGFILGGKIVMEMMSK